MTDPHNPFTTPSITTILQPFSPQSTIGFTITPYHLSISILIYYHNQLLNLFTSFRYTPSLRSRAYDFIIAALQDTIIDLYNETHHSLQEPTLSELLVVLSYRLTGPYGLVLQLLFKRFLLLITHPTLLHNYITQLSYCLPSLSRPWASGVVYDIESPFGIVVSLYLNSLQHSLSNTFTELLFINMLKEYVYFDEQYVNFKTGGAFEMAMQYTTSLLDHGYVLFDPIQSLKHSLKHSQSNLQPNNNNKQHNRYEKWQNDLKHEQNYMKSDQNSHQNPHSRAHLPNTSFQMKYNPNDTFNNPHLFYDTTMLHNNTNAHHTNYTYHTTNSIPFNTTQSSSNTSLASTAFSFVNSELSFQSIVPSTLQNNFTNPILSHHQHHHRYHPHASPHNTSTLSNISKLSQLPPPRNTHTYARSRHHRHRHSHHNQYNSHSRKNDTNHTYPHTTSNITSYPTLHHTSSTLSTLSSTPTIFLTPQHNSLFQFYEMLQNAEKAFYNDTFHAYLRYTTFRPQALFQTSNNSLLLSILQSKMGLFFSAFSSLSLQHVETVPNQTQHQLLSFHTTTLFPLLTAVSNLVTSNSKQSISSPTASSTTSISPLHQINPTFSSSSITFLSSNLLPISQLLPKYDHDLEQALNTHYEVEKKLNILFHSLNHEIYQTFLDYVKTLQTRLRRKVDPYIDSLLQVYSARTLPSTITAELASATTPRTHTPNCTLVPLISPSVDQSSDSQLPTMLNPTKAQKLIDEITRVPSLSDLSALTTALSYSTTTSSSSSTSTNNTQPSSSSTSNSMTFTKSQQQTPNISTLHHSIHLLSNPLTSLSPSTHITSLYNPIIAQLYYYDRGLKLIERNNLNFHRPNRYSILYNIYKIDARYLGKLSNTIHPVNDVEIPGVVSPTTIHLDRANLYSNLGLKFMSLLTATKSREELLNSLYMHKQHVNYGVLVTMLDSHSTNTLLSSYNGYRTTPLLSLRSLQTLRAMYSTYIYGSHVHSSIYSSLSSSRTPSSYFNQVNTSYPSYKTITISTFQQLKYYYIRQIFNQYDDILSSLVRYNPVSSSSSSSQITTGFSNLLPLIAQVPLYTAQWLYVPSNTNPQSSSISSATTSPSSSSSPISSPKSLKPSVPPSSLLYSSTSLIYLYRYNELLRLALHFNDHYSIQTTIQRILQIISYHYQHFCLSSLQLTSSPLFLLFYDIFEQLCSYALISSQFPFATLCITILLKLHHTQAQQPHNTHHQLVSLIPYFHTLSYAFHATSIYGIKPTNNRGSSSQQSLLSSSTVQTYQPFVYSTPVTTSTTTMGSFSTLRASLSSIPIITIPSLPTSIFLYTNMLSQQSRAGTDQFINDTLTITANPIIQAQINIIITLFTQISTSSSSPITFNTFPTSTTNITRSSYPTQHQARPSLFQFIQTFSSYTTTSLCTSQHNLIPSISTPLSIISANQLKTTKLIHTLITLLSILNIDQLLHATIPSLLFSATSALGCCNPTSLPPTVTLASQQQQTQSITIPGPLAQLLLLLAMVFTFVLPNHLVAQQLVALCTPSFISASSYQAWFTSTKLHSTRSPSLTSASLASSLSPAQLLSQYPQLERHQVTKYDEYLLMSWVLSTYLAVQSLPSSLSSSLSPPSSPSHLHSILGTLHRLHSYSIAAHQHSYAIFALYLLCRLSHQYSSVTNNININNNDNNNSNKNNNNAHRNNLIDHLTSYDQLVYNNIGGNPNCAHPLHPPAIIYSSPSSPSLPSSPPSLPSHTAQPVTSNDKNVHDITTTIRQDLNNITTTIREYDLEFTLDPYISHHTSSPHPSNSSFHQHAQFDEFILNSALFM